MKNRLRLKLKLLDLLELAWQEEQAFVAGLEESECVAAGTPERWVARDVIAHIAAGKERTAQALAELRQAFRLQPDLIQRSEQDPSFVALRENPAYSSQTAQMDEWHEFASEGRGYSCHPSAIGCCWLIRWPGA